MTTTDEYSIATNAALVGEVMRFHGHQCPGAAIGIRVAEAALALLGSHSRSNQIVAVVETNLCAVDPIQYLTGCTFGKRNLIHLDHGKNVFTFWQRSSQQGARIVIQPDSTKATDPEYWRIHERIHDGTSTADEQSLFQNTQETRYHDIMQMDLGQICHIQTPIGPPPGRIPATAPRRCSECGELTLGTYLRTCGRQELCEECMTNRDCKGLIT